MSDIPRAAHRGAGKFRKLRPRGRVLGPPSPVKVTYFEPDPAIVAAAEEARDYRDLMRMARFGYTVESHEPPASR